MIDFSIFTEPLGIMRIFHFIFAILAFSTTTTYTGSLDLVCNNLTYHFPIEYPFDINIDEKNLCGGPVQILANFGSEVHFYFATGILAVIYSVAIIFIYIKLEDRYKNDTRLPITDFIATVIIAVFWLSGTAAWASSISDIKNITDPWTLKKSANYACCTITREGFTRLTVSVILGFLNFFLWASDLWFVYKETSWFQNYQNQPTNH